MKLKLSDNTVYGIKEKFENAINNKDELLKLKDYFNESEKIIKNILSYESLLKNETVDKEIIKYSFIKNGVTSKNTFLYVKEKNKFKKIGNIVKNIELSFLDIDGKYLKIEGFDDEYYINIENVIEKENISKKNERYKKYILFNENIITDSKTSFFDQNNNLLFSLESSFQLPIIIKEDNKYGVEFFGQLLYVNKDEVKSVVKVQNTSKKNSSGVGVLNYHFFYDDNNSEGAKVCNQIICHSKTQFQSHLDYLKDNNILTITVEELELYIDGKINLPKSVLITIDDGWLMELGIKMLEENEMYGCVFLITSWYKNTLFRYHYKYIEFNSHGENLHSVGVCPGGQGGAIKCLEKEKLISDLKVSSDKLGGSRVFAYPFYEYNNYSIEVLKETGYIMAFAGESNHGDNLVHVGSDKYRLPRFVVVDYTTLTDLEKYFSNIS